MFKDEKYTLFVVCHHCSQTYKFTVKANCLISNKQIDVKESGTKNLKEHHLKCIKKKENDGNKSNQTVGYQTMSLPARKFLLSKSIMLVAEDMRPYNIFQGKYFKN